MGGRSQDLGLLIHDHFIMQNFMHFLTRCWDLNCLASELHSMPRNWQSSWSENSSSCSPLLVLLPDPHHPSEFALSWNFLKSSNKAINPNSGRAAIIPVLLHRKSSEWREWLCSWYHTSCSISEQASTLVHNQKLYSGPSANPNSQLPLLVGVKCVLVWEKYACFGDLHLALGGDECLIRLGITLQGFVFSRE